MSAQTGAALRNSNVEFFIDFVLRKAMDLAISESIIASYTEPARQVAFTRDDCSDVFDHFFSIMINPRQTESPVGPFEEIQIWAQTTCYKGNQTGHAEPNKTYEIRETLFEALTLRKWLKAENQLFRTIHFTVGPSEYSYGWMKAAKDSAFDLSLYPQSNDSPNFFDELNELMESHRTETERREALQRKLDDKTSVLGLHALHYLNQLLDWLRRLMPLSDEADRQAGLLGGHQITRASLVNCALEESQRGGADLKPSFIQFLRNGECEDPVMISTASELLKRTPFLTEALDASRDWYGWVSRSLPGVQNQSLEEYISTVWNCPPPKRLVWRRLLLRVHSNQGVDYVQDTMVAGVTEHNLYAGEHDLRQTKQFVKQISRNCRRVGISNASQLAVALSSCQALKLVRDSFAYEAGNGTNLKPSFIYVQQYLLPDFRCVSIGGTNIPSPKPYYSEFTDETVKPLSNLKAVVPGNSQSVLAILKAKYFNGPEFPRRAKEEGYVGLTLKYCRTNDEYKERYPGIPLIMFVDMEKDLRPPDYAIRALVRAGWNVHFSLKSLKAELEKLARDT
jgi:hypothetical protein